MDGRNRFAGALLRWELNHSEILLLPRSQSSLTVVQYVLIWLGAATKRDVTSVVPDPMVILNIGPTFNGPEVMRFEFTSDFSTSVHVVTIP